MIILRTKKNCLTQQQYRGLKNPHLSGQQHNHMNCLILYSLFLTQHSMVWTKQHQMYHCKIKQCKMNQSIHQVIFLGELTLPNIKSLVENITMLPLRAAPINVTVHHCSLPHFRHSVTFNGEDCHDNHASTQFPINISIM